MNYRRISFYRSHNLEVPGSSPGWSTKQRDDDSATDGRPSAFTCRWRGRVDTAGAAGTGRGPCTAEARPVRTRSMGVVRQNLACFLLTVFRDAFSCLEEVLAGKSLQMQEKYFFFARDMLLFMKN